MKLWGKKLTMFYLFILTAFLGLTLLAYNLQERHPSIILLRRHSVTLSDDQFTYHLNLTQYEAEFPHLQDYNCTLIKDRAGYCRTTGVKPLLLLAMKSHPDSSARRAALRQTWARDGEVSGYYVKHLFLLAYVPNLRRMRLVEEEAKAFEDILLWDFTESHYNLSLKERCFLEWLNHNCKEAEFIFKGDDDELANPDALVKYIKTTNNISCCLHGAVQHHSTVVRYGKYAVTPSLYPLGRYPLFLSGGGFLVPGVVVPALYKATIELPVFPLDDVYLGMLVLLAKVPLRHSPLFYVFGLTYEICRYKEALVVHGMTSDNLIKIWHELQDAECDPVFKWKR